MASPNDGALGGNAKLVILACLLAGAALLFILTYSPEPSGKTQTYYVQPENCTLVKEDNLSGWCIPGTVWDYRSGKYLGGPEGNFCSGNVKGKTGAVYIIREKINDTSEELCMAQIYGVSTKAKSVTFEVPNYEAKTRMGELLIEPLSGTHFETFQGAIGMDGASYYFNEGKSVEIFSLGGIGFTKERINFCYGASFGVNIIGYLPEGGLSTGCNDFRTDEERLSEGYTLSSTICSNSEYDAVMYTNKEDPEDVSIRLSPESALKFRDRFSEAGDTALSEVSDLTCLTYFNTDPMPKGGVQQVLHDLSPLNRLTNLTKVVLHHNDFRDLSPLRPFTKLRVLYTEASSLSDLSDVTYLPNLERMYLGYSNASDLSPLLGLRNLTELNLGGSKSSLNDMDTLGALGTLEELNLQGTGMSKMACGDLKDLLNNTRVWC